MPTAGALPFNGSYWKTPIRAVTTNAALTKEKLSPYRCTSSDYLSEAPLPATRALFAFPHQPWLFHLSRQQPIILLVQDPSPLKTQNDMAA